MHFNYMPLEKDFFFFTHREISASVMKSVATLKMKFKKGADSMLPPPPQRDLHFWTRQYLNLQRAQLILGEVFGLIQSLLFKSLLHTIILPGIIS